MTVLVSQVNRLRKIKPEAVQVGAGGRAVGSGQARGEGRPQADGCTAPGVGRRAWGVGEQGLAGVFPALIGTSRARRHGEGQPGVEEVLPAAAAPGLQMWRARRHPTPRAHSCPPTSDPLPALRGTASFVSRRWGAPPPGTPLLR